MKALVLALALCASAHAASFELVALGVLGGDVDVNLSCYLLGEPGAAPRVMIDGGSVVSGVLAWKRASADASWTARTKIAAAALRPIEAAFFTHAHLDHCGGFIQKTTLDILLALEGRKPLEMVGLPVTVAALRDHLMRPPLWADLTKVPGKNPAVRFSALAPGAWRAAGPYRARAIPVNHPDGGAAFLFEAKDGAAYLHVGDTGRCAELWREVRPAFRAGKLRAITLECSWPAAQAKLAAQTGHLTPSTFLLELNALAGAVKDPPARAVDFARALAPAFRACPIVVTHIKAADHDAVVAELEPLRQAGLNLIIPEQGRTYRF